MDSITTTVVWWLTLGTLVGWLASWLVARSSLRALVFSAPGLQDSVERIIERPVDNPALVARIAELERDNGQIAELKEQVRLLEAIRPVGAAGLEPGFDEPQNGDAQRTFDRERIETLNLEVVEWRERFVELERRSSEQQLTIAALEQRLATAQVPDDTGIPFSADTDGAPSPSLPTQGLDLVAAQAAGFDLMGSESLEIIEGIGPRVADVLNERGIRTLQALAEMTAAEVRSVLDTAGPNLRLVNPASWPGQAALAVTNRWTALASLQQALVMQKRRDLAGG